MSNPLNPSNWFSTPEEKERAIARRIVDEKERDIALEKINFKYRDYVFLAKLYKCTKQCRKYD